MANASEKIGQCALYLLCLAGPILAFATKGFAPLMAIAGSLACISVAMQPKQLRQIKIGGFVFTFPFLFFMGLSLFWSRSEKGVYSYFTVIMVIVFTYCLQLTFQNCSINKKNSLKLWLSGSLGFGIIVSLAIGLYPIIWPDLPSLASEISNQITFGNIELLRQSNRSLSLVPIFLFPLVGVYWQTGRWLIMLLILFSFIVTAFSNSQTAFLAICMGASIFILSYFSRYDGRKFALSIIAVGLLSSPIVF